MKKILVFGITENPGGVESVIMNYYRWIDKQKIQFDFLCNTKSVAYEEEIKSLGGNIYRVTARSENIRQYKKEMKDFFRKNRGKYEMIWVNVCSLANIDYLKYAKKYGIKYRIIHSHNSQNMDSNLRKMLHKFNKIFIRKYATDFWTCSEEAGKWFYNKKIMKSEKYVLINNAIDLEKYRFKEENRIKYRDELGLKEKLVIGNIGRFHFQKNHDFMIEILKKICEKNNKVCLVLIGAGEGKSKIEEKVEKYGLKDNVLFLGLRKDIPQLLHSMDVFLFPSLFEGLPLALLEAQAAGIDIYASKEGIPQNVKMAENFYFMSLEEGSEKWADEILSKIHSINDKSIENLKKNGYDIYTETKKIEKFFEKTN